MTPFVLLCMLLAVAPDKFSRAVGSTSASRKPPRALYEPMPIADALARSYDSDAHAVGYIADGDPSHAQFRLAKTAPAEQLAAARFTTILVDIDNANHAPWTEDLCADAIARYQSSALPFGVYHTAHGARFVMPLSTPVPVLEAEPLIRRALFLLDAEGFRVDWACKDWTRHFRMPNVVRSGRRFDTPFMDLSRMRPVALEPMAIPAREPARRQPGRTPVEIPWTPTLADHWQQRAQQIGAVMNAPGERHALGLALAGALLEKSVPPEHVPELVRLAATAAAWNAPSHHEQSARDSVARYLAGHPLRGMRELVARWPAVADAVHDAFADAHRMHLQAQIAAAPAAPPTPLEQTTSALERAIASAPDGLTVVHAECGLGKTHAAQRVAAARARSRNPDAKRSPPQTKTAIAVDKNELAIQIATDLAALGVPVRRVFGPLSVLDARGELVCKLASRALPLVEGGQSISWEFCLGRNRYRCPHYDECPARDGEQLYGDAARPRVTVGTHALLRELDGSAGTTGLLVIDEPPALLETMTLDPDDVRLALQNVDSFAPDFAEAMRPALLAIRDWASEHADLTFEDLTDTLERPPTVDAEGRPLVRPPLRFDTARACRADVGLARIVGKASGVLRAIHRAMTDADATVRLELEPERIVITAPRADLAAALRREGAVVAMDANAEIRLPEFTKVVGYDPPVHRFVAEDGAPIARTMLRCGTATRRSWLAHGRLVLDTGLLAALRGVVAWTRSCAEQLGRPVRLGVITIRLVELALLAGVGEDVRGEWVTAKQSASTLAQATDAVREIFAGAPLAGPILTAHYGATRGLNRLAGVDCLATLGDPWPNVGTIQAEATYLGVDPDDRLEAHTMAELEQAHGRLRTVHRRAPGFALHVGRVLPGGSGWKRSDVRIEALAGGRPPAGAPMPSAELRAIVDRVGGIRAVARELRCAPSSVHRYLAGRGVPPAVASALRAMAIGVSGTVASDAGVPETPIKYISLIGVSGTPTDGCSSGVRVRPGSPSLTDGVEANSVTRHR